MYLPAVKLDKGKGDWAKGHPHIGRGYQARHKGKKAPANLETKNEEVMSRSVAKKEKRGSLCLRIKKGKGVFIVVLSWGCLSAEQGKQMAFRKT